MTTHKPALRDQIKRIRLPVVDERHAAMLVEGVLSKAAARHAHVVRRLHPLMTAGESRYTDWLNYLRLTLGDCLVHEEALKAEPGQRERLLVSLDVTQLAQHKAGGRYRIPLNLIFIDAEDPEHYDTMTFGYLDEAVVRKVVAGRHHVTLKDIVQELKPYLMELAQAYADDSMPCRAQGLVMDDRAFLRCGFNVHTHKVQLEDWCPSRRWSEAQQEVLGMAVQGRAFNGRAAILASDYFNRVAAS